MLCRATAIIFKLIKLPAQTNKTIINKRYPHYKEIKRFAKESECRYLCLIKCLTTGILENSGKFKAIFTNL